MGVIKGTAKADTLTGSDLADVIKGFAGNDTLNGLGGVDLLDGGTGADTMNGGAGNDTYLVDNAGDVVVEALGGGVDTVKASISYTLASFVENLLLAGTAAINGTGNDLGNKLTGNAAANVLSGLGGNDVLDGKAGADTLIGGTGNDTYIVDNPGDVCTELGGQGTDTVQASLTWTLAANIEKLLLTGSAAIDGTGNDLANTITGNSAANALNGLGGADVLLGGAGADTLTGGAGQDVMTGGDGIDRFVFAQNDSGRTTSSADEIVDFTPGEVIDLSRIDAVAQASGYGSAGDQAYRWIGTNNFHNHTGGELRYQVISGATYVMGEMNGDTSADFVLKLNGVLTLSAADFVL